jgi:D-sedoheptulose 7-phosphate isomerase
VPQPDDVNNTSDLQRSVTEQSAELIVTALRAKGTLFVAGNGGSFADALHVAGELAKDFERPRSLPRALQERLTAISGDSDLASGLRRGLRVIVLGSNPVLTSAVDNDLAPRHAGLAQELCALGRPGDVLLAISTSGSSPNLVSAAHVAHSIDMQVVALTGPRPGRLAEIADVNIKVDGDTTATVQASYVEHYHALCRLVESGAFD